ncbi:hypothetical protein LguiB_030818 [Lonicera macranthoides]
MHGCNSGSALLVNAEVDSMGGVVDGGGGVGTKSSPRRAAIKKAQAELRQEYDVREKRRRELEFLEKGGNPLDFKSGNTASVSVQSTSLTDQQPGQFVTSEVKGSFALTASPHGDSVESSGRPGGVRSVCEPNSGDNLMLFDGENELHEGERNSVHPGRSNIVLSEQSSQLDGAQNAKESADSAAFALPKKAYRRRNRSRPNRDGARSKGLVLDTDNQKDRNVCSDSNSKPASLNGGIVIKAVLSDSPLDMELDSVPAVESSTGLTKGDLPDPVADAKVSKNLEDKPHNQIPQSGAQEAPTEMATAKVENQAILGKMNGFNSTKGDRKSIANEVQNSKKGLESDSSCTRNSLRLDGNKTTEMCTNLENIDSNGNTKEQSLAPEETQGIEGDELVKEMSANLADEICALTNTDSNSAQFHQENVSVLKTEDELKGNGRGLENEVKGPVIIEGVEPESFTASETEIKPSNFLDSNSTPHEENPCPGALQVSGDSSIRELPESTLSVKDFPVALEQQPCSQINLRLVSKAHEDSILDEARFIEKKRKRIAELSVGTIPSENRRKSHWDFVLEEMEWLANDFAQERLWKITAAAQISRRVAVASRLRFQEQNSHWKQREVAHTLAKAVLEFWHSVEDTSKELEFQYPTKDFALPIQGYAARFLKYNTFHVQYGSTVAPVTPDLGILDISWEDHLTEENLFYTVCPGTMEAYRTSIENHLLQIEKTGSSMQEEMDGSGYDAVADFGLQGNAFEEEEGETSTYYLPGAFEGSNSSKFAQKKRKNLMKAHSARSYEVGADLSFMQCTDNKVGIQQSVSIGKRPANSLNVSFPTKRVRTASRQRIISPFNIGASNKTEASSGDTNYFQDDQSTLHGGFQIPNSLEVESAGNFEKQLPFDPTEVSHKPKKKKKAKHLGSTYEHRWQLDSNYHNEQRDQSRKRLDSHQLESNGSTGLYGQHITKKPKMMRQSLDNSLDNLIPMVGSVPSPVGSSMSNMSNRNKFIKMLGGRDRRKAKALKVASGQPCSGSPWSLFEDQALVVLVHDMGPNWELVSDAINSTLQFKCIFRKPKECSERHKELMDKNADGADSAEDSGSSQPYPSTLPGIPKGSARQLFQRLQGPMEEDTLKSHFEKIIIIGQKQHCRRTQNDNLDRKQLQQPHSSHTLALSQVCPNNLSGGPILTPLELCEATTSSPEASIGYQGPHTSGLPISNQGNAAPLLPASGTTSNAVLGSNFSSPSVPLSASARYGIPRTGSLPIDEQQRMQQYNQMLSGRNLQQSSLPVPPGSLAGTDRGVRLLPGGNSMGIMGGLNRSMPIARPGFQGIPSSSMLNSASMLSSGMVAMPNSVNMHSGASPSQGNSILRPRDAMHMIRPGQNPEHQRQLIMPEMQMQVSQGSSQGVSPFGLSSSFSNQTAQPQPVQTYPLHHHQPHPMSPQQSHALTNSHHPHLQGPNHPATNTQNQAYAIRLKERQLQQQRLLQQQQQYVAPNSLMPHVQPPSQLPVSSPQNSTQSSSPPVSLTASSMPQQQPQKHQMPPHGLSRNLQSGGSVSGLPNQMGKQRQRHPQQQQQFQQAASRHHPQQRQQSQNQQQAKLLKGGGRGNNLTMHQNLPVDPSLLNGQSADSMQGQSSYSGSTLGGSSNQKTNPAQTTPSSKQPQPMVSQSDNSNQSHAPSNSFSQSVMASSNQQQPQPHSKLANQTPLTSQRVIQQNRQVNSDLPNNLQARETNSSQTGTTSTQAPMREANSSQVGTTGVTPQASNDAANATLAVSSAPLRDSGMPSNAMHSGPIGTPPLTNSAGGEPSPPVSQGLGQRQQSGNLADFGPDSGLQWQQKPPTPPPPVQPLQQPSQQQVPPPPQQQSQLKTQILQAGNKNTLYVRPTNSRME